MLFNSIEYVIFLPLVVLMYFACPYRFRWILLLAASYFFYMCWKPAYIFLIIISTLIDYFAALFMAASVSKRRRVFFLVLSLCTNLGLLFAFKYFNFINGAVKDLFNFFNSPYDIPALDVLLPVGISFYTFQTMSYTIDVYKGAREPERHFGIFALYVSFFPQLVAGPIERSTHLMPQFHRNFDFDASRVTEGLRLILWGFFKKIVIADRLALIVNQVYNDPSKYHGFPLIIGTYFFAFQIYCDFSAYSDIAIGSAKIMGFDIMENFRRPYFSRSVSEFWKRWHISLSSWFRDYLYIPLGGSRVRLFRWGFNIMVVFLLSGFWHGANWTFIIWGALHGSFLLSERFFAFLFKGFRFSMPRFISGGVKILITFHVVLLSWIFFRANSISDAFLILKNIFVFDTAGKTLFVGDKIEMLLSFPLIAFLLLVDVFQEFRPTGRLSEQPFLFRWSFYYLILMALTVLGIYTNKSDFIYFQF